MKPNHYHFLLKFVLSFLFVFCSMLSKEVYGQKIIKITDDEYYRLKLLGFSPFSTIDLTPSPSILTSTTLANFQAELERLLDNFFKETSRRIEGIVFLKLHKFDEVDLFNEVFMEKYRIRSLLYPINKFVKYKTLLSTGAEIKPDGTFYFSFSHSYYESLIRILEKNKIPFDIIYNSTSNVIESTSKIEEDRNEIQIHNLK